jgi:hypothetical protein
MAGKLTDRTFFNSGKSNGGKANRGERSSKKTQKRRCFHRGFEQDGFSAER